MTFYRGRARPLRPRSPHPPGRTGSYRVPPRRPPRSRWPGHSSPRSHRISGGGLGVAGSWPVILLAVLLAVCACAGIVAQLIRTHDQACPAKPGEIVSAQQVTAEEGYSSAPPPGLINQAEAFATCGDGQLLLLESAGQGAVQAGPVISLRIYREPGEPENDPTARQADVDALIDHAFKYAAGIRPPGAGRDIIGLLAAISADLRPGAEEVWLQTFGLPTVNPANARVLMAADPVQAVASIARWVPSLRGALVHLVLSSSVGDQPRLDTATDAWRRGFMIALLRRAGADLISVTETQANEPALPGAPPAPVIPNLPEPTPRLAAVQPGRTYTARLDSSTLFLPNSPRFLSSPGQVLEQLQPVINGWRRGDFSRVTVIGHCARFGPSAGALLLSQQRAAEIARLLRLHGMSAVTSQGVGYSQPLPPDPQSATNRVVIVTAYPKT
jgi:outer membrane protein OmpA-like peptidoglycan-associated protein